MESFRGALGGAHSTPFSRRVKTCQIALASFQAAVGEPSTVSVDNIVEKPAKNTRKRPCLAGRGQIGYFLFKKIIFIFQ
jgi:hypothetical protein